MSHSGLRRKSFRRVVAAGAVLAVSAVSLSSCAAVPTPSSAGDPALVKAKRPQPSPTSTPTSASCANPAYATSRADATWNDGGYIVHNNMWNAKRYKVSQSLYACAFDNWFVVATADNRSGDGAVKTYPNVHKDYHDWSTRAEPPLSSFTTIQTTFAATAPNVGIYDVAYDIWLNGVPGNREVMIWTENHGQVPFGSVVAEGLELSGHVWDLYASRDNSYLAFVPTVPLTQGSLDLKGMLSYLDGAGRLPANSTLGQICFGFEVVSTEGRPETFSVSAFSVVDSQG